MEQNKPVKNNNSPIVGLVMKDLADRMVKGVETYGTPLQANNGRDAMQDLYEELLDACCYIKQVIEERNKFLSSYQTKTQTYGEVNAIHDYGITR